MSVSKDDLLFLLEALGYNKLELELDEFATQFLELISSRSPAQINPKPGESLAISLTTPKVAALAFDRILRAGLFTPGCPEECSFYLGTRADVQLMVAYVLSAAASDFQLLEKELDPKINKNELYNTMARMLHHDIAREANISPAIIYDSKSEYSKEFPLGPQQVLTGALQHVAMVDEKSLSWDQVLEFRKDSEARAKYRRLIRWLDDELKSKSPEELQDLIAIRLDDYEWSVKKHGFKTVLGSLSCVLDPKFLASAAAVVGASTLAGGELWAALSSATLTFGGVAVSFGKSYVDALDERRKDNYEVAYIHDIKKAAK